MKIKLSIAAPIALFISLICFTISSCFVHSVVKCLHIINYNCLNLFGLRNVLLYSAYSNFIYNDRHSNLVNWPGVSAYTCLCTLRQHSLQSVPFTASCTSASLPSMKIMPGSSSSSSSSWNLEENVNSRTQLN